MPTFVYKCDTCGRVEDRWFASLDERTKYEEYGAKPCKPNPTRRCQGKLHRQASAPSFSIKGFSAENGYSNKGVG